jgi:lactoylglutathione lyase
MFKINNIRHLGILIYDLEKSLDFYINFLGFSILKITYENDMYIQALLGIDKLTHIKLQINENQPLLELYYIKNINSYPFYNHISFTVEDIFDLYNNLEAIDLRPISRPIENKEKTFLVMFSRDPSGNLIEWVEPITK